VYMPTCTGYARGIVELAAAINISFASALR
jgi:hypothetical protein